MFLCIETLEVKQREDERLTVGLKKTGYKGKNGYHPREPMGSFIILRNFVFAVYV